MSLLTPNATPLMRAVEAAALRDLPVQIDMWNPQTCAENLLPWLAWALHVTDSEGWSQAMTVQDKRNLLSAAFILHRSKGTVQSVKDAIAAIGLGAQSRLIEGGIQRIADGMHIANGSITASHASWAEYSIEADLGEDSGLSLAIIDKIRATCAEYAPVSRHLDNVTFAIKTSDQVATSTDASVSSAEMADYIDPTPHNRYDGTLRCDGSVLAGDEQDPGTASITLSDFDIQRRFAVADGGTLADGYTDGGETAPMAEDGVMAIWMTRILRGNGRHLGDGSAIANSGIPVFLEAA
ncbi:MAG: phage tail protein I [Nitrosomonadales bacterium]|nr:phage tail protein I [Nitrosomonadales bacterium]